MAQSEDNMLKRLLPVLGILLVLLTMIPSCREGTTEGEAGSAQEPFPATSTPVAALPATAPPSDTPVPPPPATATPLAPTIRITADYLNVRDRPSTSDSIVMIMVQQGTMLPALGRTADGAWAQIMLSDGRRGWVAAEWAEPSVPLESLPILEEGSGPVSMTTPTTQPGTAAAGEQVTATTEATTEPTAEATPTPAMVPAPILIEPYDGQAFGAAGPPQFRWSWNGSLESDQYFVIMIDYPHDQAIWQDIHWVKETGFSPPAYLRDLITGDGRCTWHVVVMRQTGTGSDGMKTGEPVSQPSDRWSFVWGK